MKLYTTQRMSKKKTSNKEFKPKVEDKKEIAISIPTTPKFWIYLYKTKQEYEVTNEIGSVILKTKRGRLV